ncbi:glycine betaine/L-proline ABC transporter ATP-binding protein [Heliorestis acidaminivorans]|uniref:Quaternary amine transport ATP-binding protein n=1 Tax=Heliorestis acidaminivorans TaxID=553427 RepID=A0A6I0F2I8_9FIRM|nr:glycine betaine/L-proline ABC transporter ATP-binding protein [Heliorestis acidaminivorans]KAB2951295.1 glycine betaine/L-proline ABC transporter ATP-binding protein [Heliorestis acidaminivorans]
MAEKTAKIEVRNVSKLFGKQQKKALAFIKEGKSKQEILEQTGVAVGVYDVNFDVQPGEIFVIMGLSGSGKSTLLRMLNRLIEPTSGEIYIDGVDLVKMKDEELRDLRRKKISMVFQRFALLPHRTVLQNAAYGLEIQGMEESERKSKAQQALELVGLKGWEDSFPDELSGGMQQRVGLARALANDPDVLLMDEAFSALDPLIRKDMQDELLALQSTMEKTIIFITHDLDEALRIGDRIALMKDGKIVQLGTPEEILMNPSNAYVERFVEDIDLSRVLTAAHVMVRPETMGIDKGPRVALQLMRDRGISSIYIVDRKKLLLGVVTAQDASRAIEKGLVLQDILISDVPTVPLDRLLTDLFDLVANTSVPVAVIDEEGRIKGVLIRGAILGALAGNKDAISLDEATSTKREVG